jgi:type II secretory pathway predicted ATPase ExeA
LSKDETAAYVKAELVNAQMSSPVFTETAITRLYAYTQGIPRIINLICTGALFNANVSDDNVVEEKHIARVIVDIEKQRGSLI